jgi:hypothetical protein
MVKLIRLVLASPCRPKSSHMTIRRVAMALFPHLYVTDRGCENYHDLTDPVVFEQ